MDGMRIRVRSETRRDRRGSDAPTPNTPRDQGFTFIEMVVSITLMAIVMIPIMGAVQMAITQSSRSRSSAQVETAIVNAADRVNRAPKECDYLEYVQAAVRSQQWDGDQATVVEEHYDPPVYNSSGDIAGLPADPWLPGACPTASASDLLVQRVTITITSPDNRVVRTIQVVKSDV